jgi:multiple sugar transport system substrate-binding protein
MGVNLKRWTTATASITLLGALLSGCGGGSGETKATGTAANTSGKPFAGKSISVYLSNNSTTDVIKPMIPEFESQTGMKVELQSFEQQQTSQKLAVQFTANSSTPDVYMIRPLEEVKLFYKNGWMTPLDDYVKKDPGYDFADFQKSSIESTTLDGKLLGIPMVTEQQIIYYRKDLLEKANIPVPKTLDEFEAAVKKLHDPNNGMYGFVGRGQKSALVTQLSSFIYSEGGDFQKGDKAAVNTPEAIKGMTRYANLLKNYSPPGVLNMSWQQAAAIFAQGKAAFYTDATSIMPNTIEPGKSVVGDKIGFAPFPAGSAGSKPYGITAWALVINSKSANKDAGWAFIQWATSKDFQLKNQLKGSPGARTSVSNDPKANAGYPAGFVQVIGESIKNAVGHDRPQVISVGESRDIVGDIVVKAVMGEDIKAAADKANKDFQAIIDKENGK